MWQELKYRVDIICEVPFGFHYKVFCCLFSYALVQINVKFVLVFGTKSSIDFQIQLLHNVGLLRNNNAQRKTYCEIPIKSFFAVKEKICFILVLSFLFYIIFILILLL